MPRVSVVIPVYNVESYLALSVESVRRQTFDDLEIICVNDGSTDASREVLALLESADARIVVVDKPNGGLSSARNAGIERATGDIVCFLDSDDLLEENACEVIAEAFARTGADVVTYGATPYPEFRGYWWLNHILSPRRITYEGFQPPLLFEESSHPFAWRTACTRAFLQASGLRFDETLAFGEDQLFHFSLYPRSARTALIPDKLVKYRVSRAGSLMFSNLDDPTLRIRRHRDIVERIFADWQEQGYLASYTEELFSWSVEFIVLDLITLSAADAARVTPSMAELWRRFFDEAFLDNAERNRCYGHLVRFVRAEGRDGIDGRRARFRYYAFTYGYLDAAKRLGRWVRDRTWGRLVRAVRRSPSEAEEGVCLDERWEREDEAEREASLRALQCEAASLQAPLS